MGQRPLQHVVRNRSDRLEVPGGGLALLQARNRCERLMYRHRDEFVFDSPLEGPLDASHVLVDVLAAVASVDHPLPNCLEGQGPEFVNSGGPVRVLEHLHGSFDARLLARWLSILHVERLRESPVGCNQFHHGDALSAMAQEACGRSVPTRQPAGHILGGWP